MASFKVGQSLCFLLISQDTKTILNQLLRADYVSLQVRSFAQYMLRHQEVPKHSDRTPQRCHFLWTVKLDLLVRTTINNVLKAYV